MKAIESERKPRRKLVGRVGELAHGATKKFRIARGEGYIEALLVNYEGHFYAYLNRCPHIGISLDWVDNQFFTVDHRYLICANHGAVFEPPTGECIWGPCVGAALEHLTLDIEGDKIFARLADKTDE